MTMFNKVTKSFQYGEHTVVLETGEIARQASGAVLVSIEDTVVLATVVGKSEAKAGQDFFPLTVDYVEKTYSAGKIPGGFFKREGRQSEREILISRLRSEATEVKDPELGVIRTVGQAYKMSACPVPTGAIRKGRAVPCAAAGTSRWCS